MTRDAGLLGHQGDLAQGLDDDAEHGVVGDLPDRESSPSPTYIAAPAQRRQQRLHGVVLGLAGRTPRPGACRPWRPWRCPTPARSSRRRRRRSGPCGSRPSRVSEIDDMSTTRLGRALPAQHAAGAEQDVLQVVGGRDHGEDGGAVRHGRLVGHHLGADLGQRIGLRRRAVPHRKPVSRLHQPGRHGLAHAAKPDPADVVRCLAACERGTSASETIRAAACEATRRLSMFIRLPRLVSGGGHGDRMRIGSGCLPRLARARRWAALGRRCHPLRRGARSARDHSRICRWAGGPRTGGRARGGRARPGEGATPVGLPPARWYTARRIDRLHHALRPASMTSPASRQRSSRLRIAMICTPVRSLPWLPTGTARPGRPSSGAIRAERIDSQHLASGRRR